MDVGSIEGFSESVTLTSNAIEIFNSANFSRDQVIAGSNSVFTINSAGTTPGEYTIELQGAFGENIKTRYIDLTVSPNTPIVLSNVFPNEGAANLSLNPTFEWTSSDPSAIYHLQVATDPNFNQLVIDEENISTTNYASSIDLEHNRTYFWRVQANLSLIHI